MSESHAEPDEADANPGDQVKDTFSELGSSSDNLGDGGEDAPAEEPVRDWPPLHSDS